MMVYDRLESFSSSSSGDSEVQDEQQKVLVRRLRGDLEVQSSWLGQTCAHLMRQQKEM